jgi:hypothetical protein
MYNPLFIRKLKLNNDLQSTTSQLIHNILFSMGALVVTHAVLKLLIRTNASLMHAVGGVASVAKYAEFTGIQ